MAEHNASVMIQAPVHQVYELFSHLNDFPKFMSFVKEVTYYDEQRSHWVVQILGQHEWDAINEEWIPDRQIGWRSISGLRNVGRVKFRPLTPSTTMVDVYVAYTPPTGPIGAFGENVGGGSYFESLLQRDLTNFARMVEQAPPDALDPMSSHYLFHKESAIARGRVTPRQKKAMQHDPMMSNEALSKRQEQITKEQEATREARRTLEEARQLRMQQEQQTREEQQAVLAKEATRRFAEQRAREAVRLAALEAVSPPDPVYDTLGGRHAAWDRTPLGDKDALRPRHPGNNQDPMLSRYPRKVPDPAKPSVEAMELDSPWRKTIRAERTPTTPLPAENEGGAAAP